MNDENLSENRWNILVVEDSPDSINVIRTTLEGAGYCVFIATSGETALERITLNIPDLILLDIMLPGMNGYETCIRIKKEEKWKYTPIIFLSALSEPCEKVMGFRAGAIDYLIKPFSAEELLIRVHTHLNVSRLHNQVLAYSKELEERLHDLDSFTYMVSHDLRGPIRAVDGYAHLLSLHAGDEKSEAFTHYLKKIHDNIRIMDHLIEDLLNLSRMSRKELQLSLIPMRDLVNAVVKEMEDFYPQIRFDVSITDIPPAYGDPNLIKQVYINLLSNAMKFSKGQSCPIIIIGYVRYDTYGEYFVKDNGIGFDMQFAEKIFDVFFQLPQPDTNEGSGVGLAIVKRIINRHDGKIRVLSKEGSGTCFYFTLREDICL